jgi:DNA-binding LacI/PurR family transcriptional regulator
MAVGLRDVAAHAGVSVKTVSNVVNGYPHVSPATRARVEAAVAELGYRPNLSARNLRGGRSGVIALAVPELGVPYFAELAQWVVEAAAERGFTVLIDQTGGRADQERLVLEGMRAQLIDGLILSPLSVDKGDVASRRDSTPLVLLGERISGTLADHVAIDNITAARDAVLHLIQQGRQRVAAIGAQPGADEGTAQLRLTGYRQALKQSGLPYDSELVAETQEYHRLDGGRAMARLLDGQAVPDAVFAFNDLLALGALRACYDRGVRIPEDIALAGFDDIDDGRHSVPSLSTVSPDKEQIARVAVSLLMSRLRGADGASCITHYVAKHQLVVRESSAGAAASLPLWAR